jgi:hypothetical protein
VSYPGSENDPDNSGFLPLVGFVLMVLLVLGGELL